jgi:hypothetical protein
MVPLSSAAPGGSPRPRRAHQAPPELGEHTVDVLLEAGFDAAAIDALLANKVVFQAEHAAPAAHAAGARAGAARA